MKINKKMKMTAIMQKLQSINKKGYQHPFPNLFIKTSLEKRLETQSCITPTERLIKNFRQSKLD